MTFIEYSMQHKKWCRVVRSRDVQFRVFCRPNSLT